MENSDADRQLEPVSDPVIVGALGENLETGAIEQPPTKTKGNKRAALDSPVSRKDAVLEPSVASAREGSTEAAAGAQPDEPPKKKKKSKKKKSAEKQVELSEGAVAQEIVVHDSYVGDARARAGEESSDPRALPLEKKKRKKRSVAQPGPTLSVHDDRQFKKAINQAVVERDRLLAGKWPRRRGFWRDSGTKIITMKETIRGLIEAPNGSRESRVAEGSSGTRVEQVFQVLQWRLRSIRNEGLIRRGLVKGTRSGPRRFTASREEVDGAFGPTRPFGELDGVFGPTRPFGELDGVLGPTRPVGELDCSFGFVIRFSRVFCFRTFVESVLKIFSYKNAIFRR
ncbi:hypothetical protein F2Q70_00029380 [Brassica cretica]|uniref:Uncharacterized protein n=1 Tax=Brassica cretica TaxID=69181 RepID=A0A8S9FET6_BRACR|nr:hypothetical protein F2Q70_00029380 [Brassica cretica]